ncbi:MAG TPA: PAS domain-containing protein [Chitinophagaceae bacterium]|nr:PAS domain-containing protein [Chitinophagaceae bacterium]
MPLPVKDKKTFFDATHEAAVIHGGMFEESLQRYKLLSLTTNEGIWDYNLETGLTYYNKGISRLFGYNKDDMRDNFTWWRENLHPSDKKRVIERLEKLLKGKESAWWGEYLFRCKSGTYKLVLEKLYVVRDGKGKPYRIVGTMQDLTKIKEIEKRGEDEKIRQQREMTKAIMKAEEEERREISDELNENINQVLATINLHIEQVKREADNYGRMEWLNNAQQLLRLSIENIRSISKQLTPASLLFFGLLPSVEEFLQTTHKRTKIKFHLKADDGVEKKTNKEKKLLLYRIVQLQVKNIRTHSSATNAHIQMQLVSDKIKLSIKDNGNGFDTAKLKFGYGFSRILRLTEAYKGSFSVKSRPGKGCTLEILL